VSDVIPAWGRVTPGEPRWPASVAIVVALVLQATLPKAIALHPRVLAPLLAALLLVGIVASNPFRIDRESSRLRVASIVLIGVLSSANVWSGEKLVRGLIQNTITFGPGTLLLAGGAIWLTNFIVFALWYWELDRGGPAARANATHVHPDFLFVQMQTPSIAPPDWEPAFADYLFLSFTNATAFSPTDTLPLTRWAKLTMMLQAAVSVSTVALVISRAVNLFPTRGK
jgi:hypothetical protein